MFSLTKAILQPPGIHTAGSTPSWVVRALDGLQRKSHIEEIMHLPPAASLGYKPPIDFFFPIPSPSPYYYLKSSSRKRLCARPIVSLCYFWLILSCWWGKHAVYKVIFHTAKQSSLRWHVCTDCRKHCLCRWCWFNKVFFLFLGVSFWVSDLF